ncbi:neuroligin-2-like [Bacillus rossius redtenbacheri]|uniref:neuroligin-2-like n=1 Tax=Bacillus rossius redtenbacheri TaxID=93214 RepID=UPI002FDD8FBF
MLTAGPDPAAERLPVMVFVHGESYEWNSGNHYDGSALAGYDGVVVVTLNYRLGILGFLNANPAPQLKARVANYGLMDQIAALHWVQQNIAAFGGDPSNVTLMGHGTGAACINFLMTSPTVMPGLFHRAILLSGSSLSSWALVEEPVDLALRLARQVGCPAPLDVRRDHEQVVDCLRLAPLRDLLRADVAAPAYLSAFGPSVDGVVVRHDSSPAALLAGRSYDLLFGVVSAEALWRFSARDLQAGFEGARRDRILRTYVRNAYSYHLSEIFFAVANEYTDWERTALHPANTRDATVAALGDAEVVAPLVRTGELHSRRLGPGPQARSFFCVFDYQSRDSDYPQRMGTAHGEELPYVFGAPLAAGLGNSPRNYTRLEAGLSEAVMLYFSNFARTGNPNSPSRQEAVSPLSKERNRFRSIVWEEYDNVHQKYLEISLKPRVKSHYRAHQLSVWLRLVPELHRAGMEDALARHNLLRDSHQPPGAGATPAPAATCAPAPPQSTRLLQRANRTAGARPSPRGAYPAALALTIAIGCSLLVLNVLIFAGVYYRRARPPPPQPPPPGPDNNHLLANNLAGICKPRRRAPHEVVKPSNLAALKNGAATLPLAARHPPSSPGSVSLPPPRAAMDEMRA